MKRIEDETGNRRATLSVAGRILRDWRSCWGAGCKKQAAAPLPPPVVQSGGGAATNAMMTTEIIGQLDSPQNVQVRARIEAFVDKVLFTEGTR
jgi:hypothetical protein